MTVPLPGIDDALMDDDLGVVDAVARRLLRTLDYRDRRTGAPIALDPADIRAEVAAVAEGAA